RCPQGYWSTQGHSSLHREAADFADEVNGSGGDDEAVGRRDEACLGERGGKIRRDLGWDVECLSCGEELFETRRSGVVDRSEEDVVFPAFGIPGARVKEGEENLRHLAKVLVTKTAEDQSAGLGFGQFGDRRTERPGTRGVMGY